MEAAGADGTDLADSSPSADPELRACHAEFVATLARQLQRLPEHQARAFCLRECQGSENAEICAALNITERHLWVLVHRARSRLQIGLALSAPSGTAPIW